MQDEKKTKAKAVVAATVSFFIMGGAPAYAENAEISLNGSRPSIVGALEPVADEQYAGDTE